jgi:energy-coupling factor transporter ATP-binding protein EcfA2
MRGAVNVTLAFSKFLIWLIQTIGWLLRGFGPLVKFALTPLQIMFRPLLRRLQSAESRRKAERRRKAEGMARSLSHELGRLGFSYRRKGQKLQKVVFDEPALLTRDELWLPIVLKSLPHRVTTEALTANDVIRSLKDRLGGADVRWDTLPSGKFCYVIRIAGTAFPTAFPIQGFELPADAPPLAFPLGLDGEGKHRVLDLAKLPHLLVVGPTGKGKSTLIHTILSTWLTRNTARDIEIWLADHKGGAELNRYAALSGSKQSPGIVRRFSYKPEDTIAMLQAAQKELEKRLEILRLADCSDVDDYFQQTGNHMRRIAIVIDEIFFLMLNKEPYDPQPGKKISIRDWAEQLFAKIASAGRAPGLHLIIATQKTGKDVLTGMITGNFECRIVFGLADMYQSIYVLGNSDAVGMPKGRAIFRGESDSQVEVQTPLITAQQTRLLLDRVSRYGPDGGLGRADHQKRFIDDAKLLLQVSCDLFAGEFAIRKLYQAPGVQGVLSKQRVEEILSRLEKDGILEPGGPRKPRRVARGYFGMPQLLEARYDPDRPKPFEDQPGQEQDVSLKKSDDPSEQISVLSHQEAIDEMNQIYPDTSYDLSNPPSPPPASESGPEPELPGFMRAFIDGLGGKPPAPAPIKPAQPAPRSRTAKYTKPRPRSRPLQNPPIEPG